MSDVEEKVIKYLRDHGRVSGAQIVQDLPELDPEAICEVLEKLTTQGKVHDHGQSESVCPFCDSAKTHVINARWSSTRQLLNMHVDRICEACGRVF
jgi:Fe2+ or Zn2+ uptake regulation protein